MFNVSQNNDAVYFDYFTVSYTRGRIIEACSPRRKNHYYAFGLRIAGISSRKYDGGMEGSHQGGQALKNGYLYQGDFAELDEDVGWTDFELRNYDAQLGRWIQQDPFAQFHSLYSGMGNDPVNLIDPSGGVGIPCPGTSQLALFFMKAGEVALNALNTIGPVSTVVSNTIQVAGSAANIYNRSLEYRIISQQLVGNATGQVGGNGSRPPDWYRDGGGMMQYDPNVKGQEDLSLSFRSGRYVGKTYSEVTSRGDKIDYRIDGSVLFDNENDAYQRMITIGASREAMAVDVGSKILYLPDYNNRSGETYHDKYGYILSGNKIYDPVLDRSRTISFTIHTHLYIYNGIRGGDYGASLDDAVTFEKLTPNVPYLIVGHEKVRGYFGIWLPRKDGNYYNQDRRDFKFLELPASSFFMGLRKIVRQKRSQYGNF